MTTTETTTAQQNGFGRPMNRNQRPRSPAPPPINRMGGGGFGPGRIFGGGGFKQTFQSLRETISPGSGVSSVGSPPDHGQAFAHPELASLGAQVLKGAAYGGFRDPSAGFESFTTDPSMVNGGSGGGGGLIFWAVPGQLG